MWPGQTEQARIGHAMLGRMETEVVTTLNGMSLLIKVRGENHQ